MVEETHNTVTIGKPMSFWLPNWYAVNFYVHLCDVVPTILKENATPSYILSDILQGDVLTGAAITIYHLNFLIFIVGLLNWIF